MQSTIVQQQQQSPFYGHCTGQPALAGTSSQQLEDFLVQSFTARNSPKPYFFWFMAGLRKFAAGYSASCKST